MHPILAVRGRLGFYLLAWVPIAAGFALLFERTGHLSWLHSTVAAITLALFYGLVCLSSWFSCQFLPLSPVSIPKILLNQTAAAITAAAMLIGVAKLVDVPTLDLPPLALAGVLLYLLAVALHYALLSFQSSRLAESREQEARVLAREAELKALKAQINPHFLFNSLNSISALATIDGKRAREMCLRLSDFLRSTLNLADKEMIPLEQEMALAKTYLDVERVRFGDRLRVEQTVGPQCGDCMVPSLILQPLVENAVKHGIAGLVSGGRIDLDVQCIDGFLHIGLKNDFDPEGGSATRNGVGLVNVRNRLKARYQNRARLTTEVRDNRFCVEVDLPCEP